jgi:outer membrane protein OmpA-like peptidoglycan-associated protein
VQKEIFQQKEEQMKNRSHVMVRFCTVSFLCLLWTPVQSQSTITLDSFDLSAPVNSNVQAATPAEQEGVASCLFLPEGCEKTSAGSRSFSLDDVVNLGIVNRSEVKLDADPEEAARVAATPLPSIDLEVMFEYASDTLSGDQIGDLYALARELQNVDFSGRQLVLMGHTDGVGSAAYNRDLSLRRANSVASFLSREAGIPRYQIRTAGMGFDYLKYSSDPANSANRRVQILLVEG